MSDVDFDFDTPSDATAPVVPSCTFKLGGRAWSCRPSESVPWNLVNTAFHEGDEGGVFIEVERFFRGVLVAEDIDPFVAMINDADSPLTVGNVADVAMKVAEKVLQRPTAPSANSGRPRRKRSSVGGSSSPDTARIASVG